MKIAQFDMQMFTSVAHTRYALTDYSYPGFTVLPHSHSSNIPILATRVSRCLFHPAIRAAIYRVNTSEYHCDTARERTITVVYNNVQIS